MRELQDKIMAELWNWFDANYEGRDSEELRRNKKRSFVDDVVKGGSEVLSSAIGGFVTTVDKFGTSVVNTVGSVVGFKLEHKESSDEDPYY